MSSLGLNLERLEQYNAGYKLDLGAVTSRAFGIWTANFVPFTVLAYALHAPFYALNWLLLQPQLGHTAATARDGSRLVTLLTNLAELVLAGAVSYGVFEHLRGARPSTGAILRMGFARVVPVLGTAIFVGLATGLATCALIIPGFVVASMLCVAVPVTVIEGDAGLAALRRSRDLTAGNRWSVFGLLMVIGLVSNVPAMVVSAGWTLLSGHELSPLGLLLTGAVLLPLVPLDGVARVVCYHDLRVGREGAAVEDLVKVFD